MVWVGPPFFQLKSISGGNYVKQSLGTLRGFIRHLKSIIYDFHVNFLALHLSPYLKTTRLLLEAVDLSQGDTQNG